MKKITLTLGVVALFSSCGIQFGNYEKWKQINKPSMCQNEVTEKYWVASDGTKHTGQVEDYYIEMTQDEFYDSLECCNCDEID
tara:strand:+ start:460 stop:708 length:249 start_codon:yes stop_codon:yes gene_type:complete